MPRRLSLSSLEKKLDRVFSEYIRLRDSDGNTGACVTCGRLIFWKEGHCGHFIKRQHRIVRWNPLNAALQCVSCNTYHGGRQDEFAKHIIKRYGLDAFNDLMTLKHKTIKHSRGALEEMISFYQSKTRELSERAA